VTSVSSKECDSSRHSSHLANGQYPYLYSTLRVLLPKRNANGHHGHRRTTRFACSIRSYSRRRFPVVPERVRQVSSINELHVRRPSVRAYSTVAGYTRTIGLRQFGAAPLTIRDGRGAIFALLARLWSEVAIVLLSGEMLCIYVIFEVSNGLMSLHNAGCTPPIQS